MSLQILKYNINNLIWHKINNNSSSNNNSKDKDKNKNTNNSKQMMKNNKIIE